MRGRLINILIGVIISVFAFFCTALIAWFATMVSRDGLIGLVIPAWRDAGVAISVIAYGVVWDFFQYWFHRWQHMSPALWPSHRVHHSDNSVNTTSALRRSVFELFLIFIFVLVPTVIVAGVDRSPHPSPLLFFMGGASSPRQCPAVARTITVRLWGRNGIACITASTPNTVTGTLRPICRSSTSFWNLPRSVQRRVSCDRCRGSGRHHAPVPGLLLPGAALRRL